ncbi:hypothetical protein [Corynebacterium aurimucosum]|uniref:hypothetical protein n=1 Tax=Corynebacterium aurimucosum TaxID=169292 RepID=UPI0037581C13
MDTSPSKTNDESTSFWQAASGLIGIIVALLGWLYYGVALIVLASLVTLGSIAVGVFLILRSYETGDTKFRAISSEIEQLNNDASFDISEELIVWEKLKYTKGIGTKIAGQNSDIDDIHRRLLNVREELAQASTPVHRIEAVLAADSVLSIAQELRTPEQG